MAGRNPTKLKVAGDDSLVSRALATEARQDETIAELEKLVGFEIPAFDYIALTYTGDNLTGVVYKTGGAGGSTVATLTLAYTGAVLDTITKT